MAENIIAELLEQTPNVSTPERPILANPNDAAITVPIAAERNDNNTSTTITAPTTTITATQSYDVKPTIDDILSDSTTKKVLDDYINARVAAALKAKEAEIEAKSAVQQTNNANQQTGNVNQQAANVNQQAANVNQQGANINQQASNVQQQTSNIGQQENNSTQSGDNTTTRQGNAIQQTNNANQQTGNVNQQAANVNQQGSNINQQASNVRQQENNVEQKTGNDKSARLAALPAVATATFAALNELQTAKDVRPASVQGKFNLSELRTDGKDLPDYKEMLAKGFVNINKAGLANDKGEVFKYTGHDTKTTTETTHKKDAAGRLLYKTEYNACGQCVYQQKYNEKTKKYELVPELEVKSITTIVDRDGLTALSRIANKAELEGDKGDIVMLSGPNTAGKEISLKHKGEDDRLSLVIVAEKGKDISYEQTAKELNVTIDGKTTSYANAKLSDISIAEGTFDANGHVATVGKIVPLKDAVAVLKTERKNNITDKKVAVDKKTEEYIALAHDQDPQSREGAIRNGVVHNGQAQVIDQLEGSLGMKQAQEKIPDGVKQRFGQAFEAMRNLIPAPKVAEDAPAQPVPAVSGSERIK